MTLVLGNHGFAFAELRGLAALLAFLTIVTAFVHLIRGLMYVDGAFFPPPTR